MIFIALLFMLPRIGVSLIKIAYNVCLQLRDTIEANLVTIKGCVFLRNFPFEMWMTTKMAQLKS